MALNDLPIPALLAIVIVLVIFSIESGYRTGKLIRRRRDVEKESPVASISGYILGLLAFIIAFTFGIVTERYETRKQLVRDEANVLRSLWLYTDFLPDSVKASAQNLIKNYTTERIAASKSFNAREIDQALAVAGITYEKLWGIGVAESRQHPESDVSARFVEQLSELSNVSATRHVVAFHTRLPGSIWYVLLILILLGMFSVGYQTAISGSERSWVILVLAISFSIVIVLIETLDRGHTAMMPISQYPMEYLLDQMNHGLHSDPEGVQ